MPPVLQPLSNSPKYFSIDSEDGHLVIGIKWRLNNGRIVGSIDGKDVSLANYLLGDPEQGKVWDHKDRDPLNNQRTNFRKATIAQNNYNRSKSRTSSRNFIGTYKENKNYTATVQKDDLEYRISGFKTEEEAARARDYMAFRLHGKFASLNFPTFSVTPETIQKIDQIVGFTPKVNQKKLDHFYNVDKNLKYLKEVLQ